MKDEGWELHFDVKKRENGVEPRLPVSGPPSFAYNRDTPQTFHLYAPTKNSLTGMLIVGVCIEFEVHTKEERKTFINNAIMLCEQQIGGTND